MSGATSEAATLLPETPVAPPPAPEAVVHRDMMFLAGELLHRSAQTHFERRAAEYIRDRFREYTPDVEMDDFHAIENPLYLFGSYFGEFLVVGFLAMFWPLFAMIYGFGVLAAFLAEYHGYRLFGRLLPEYETQNVVARFLSLRPRKLIVVMAHYDSGGASPLAHPAIIPWLRPGLHVLLGCMVFVLATCGAETWADLNGDAAPWLLYLRWAAVAVLTSAAAFMFYCSRQVEDIRGANGNASGTAALLLLAQRLKAQSIEGADIWLAATGSHEAWMSGARRVLAAARATKQPIEVINIESVGAGRLHFTTHEGLLTAAKCGKGLCAAASSSALDFEVRAASLRTVPTGAHPALARGIAAMSIIGLDDDGVPVHWNQIEDRVMDIEDRDIVRAAQFAESVLRKVAAEA